MLDCFGVRMCSELEVLGHMLMLVHHILVPEGYLFVAVSGGARILPKDLTEQSFYSLAPSTMHIQLAIPHF